MPLTGFDDRGFARLEAVFSADEARAMREVVWRELLRVHGISRDDPRTWSIERVTRLQAIKADPVFDPISGSRLIDAVDVLLGSWDRPRQWGALLVSFPSGRETWTVPSGQWHPDYHFHYEPRPLFGLGVFSYLSDVRPGAGGTIALARSHQLVEKFAQSRSADQRTRFAEMKAELFASDPWLENVALGNEDAPDRRELLGAATIIDGVELELVELSGNAGDIVLMHPWLLHSFAPNCGTTPRMMRVCNLYRAGS